MNWVFEMFKSIKNIYRFFSVNRYLTQLNFFLLFFCSSINFVFHLSNGIKRRSEFKAINTYDILLNTFDETCCFCLLLLVFHYSKFWTRYLQFSRVVETQNWLCLQTTIVTRIFTASIETSLGLVRLHVPEGTWQFGRYF